MVKYIQILMYVSAFSSTVFMRGCLLINDINKVRGESFPNDFNAVDSSTNLRTEIQ